MASEAHIKLMVAQESRPEDWSVKDLKMKAKMMLTVTEMVRTMAKMMQQQSRQRR